MKEAVWFLILLQNTEQIVVVGSCFGSLKLPERIHETVVLLARE